MKTLHLVRHAQAGRAAPGVGDHDRVLTARGRETAARLGEELRRTGSPPQLVLCSTARRARETLEELALTGVDARLEREVYDATAGDLLTLLGRDADAVDVVLLIGHNPAVHELAVMLAGSGPDLSRLAAEFPAGSLATIAAPVERWPDVGPGGARLHRFVSPEERE